MVISKLGIAGMHSKKAGFSPEIVCCADISVGEEPERHLHWVSQLVCVPG